jgi:microsomal dipeptidase-like Zn-dependent dipeptidase
MRPSSTSGPKLLDSGLAKTNTAALTSSADAPTRASLTAEGTILTSYSSCRAISGHQRNMTDEMIKAMAAKGGVIQITFVDEFLDAALYNYNQKALPLEEELQQRFPGRENAATAPR